MNENIYPQYYTEFHCIADKCKHTCCAGWEIDIDEESLKRFEKDGIGHIEKPSDDLPHFTLKVGDRCPFLRDDNLCQMIIDHGEDYICNICKDHPRFRNFWSDFTEIGLGLSCEESARLILEKDIPMELLTDGKKSLKEYVLALPSDEKYLWDVREQVLEKARSLEDPMQARLAEYFAYRQIPDALYDGLLDQRISFVWYSVNEITRRWNQLKDQSFENLVEVAREYSEYYEYNPERLKNLLESF